MINSWKIIIFAEIKRQFCTTESCRGSLLALTDRPCYCGAQMLHICINYDRNTSNQVYFLAKYQPCSRGYSTAQYSKSQSAPSRGGGRGDTAGIFLDVIIQGLDNASNQPLSPSVREFLQCSRELAPSSRPIGSLDFTKIAPLVC